MKKAHGDNDEIQPFHSSRSSRWSPSGFLYQSLLGAGIKRPRYFFRLL